MPHSVKKLRYTIGALCTLALSSLVFSSGAGAQTTSRQNPSNPATITTPPAVEAVPASPMRPPSAPPVVESSAQASPVHDMPHGVYVMPKAVVNVRLTAAADSGQVRNGHMLQATLVAPVKLSNGKVLPAGTPVGVSVLAAARAGSLQSAGEMTLQVTKVGPMDVFTDAKTFFGQEGHKDVADSAPQKGTEASVPAGTTLQFVVPEISW